jgi:Sulfatase
MDRSPNAATRWSSAASYALAWFPAAALGLYLKHAFMEKEYLVIARALGRDVETDISAWEAFSFYRADILLSLVLIPLGLALLLGALPARFRAAIALTVSGVFVLFFFVNLQTLGNVGRYMSIGLLFDTLRWGAGHSEFIEEYLPPATLLKLAIVLLSVAGLSVLAMVGSARRPRRTPARAGLPLAFAALLGLGLMAEALAWMPRLPALPQHRSVLEDSLLSFFDRSKDGASEFAGMGTAEVVAFYRTFARAAVPVRDARFWGKAADRDVILFIFETGPARTLDLAGDLGEFPSLRALAARSFVAVNHHSTYPYTSAALFSIFSSLYPPRSMRLQLRNHPEAIQTGLMRRLADQGYATRAYTPYAARFEEDEKMFARLGIQRTFIAEQAAVTPNPVLAHVDRELTATAPMPPAVAERFRSKLRHELTALEALKTDIVAFKRSGQRFAAAIMPQIGHAPWPDVRGRGDDYPARGRALMAMQDGWLGGILDVLRATSLLDTTLIVVTSDHGIRTRAEDPGFKGGTISDYSFHVPLLVYAPTALHAPVKIEWLTSHVDIAPTVLDLVGVTRQQESEQGTAIWDARLPERTTFLLARGYLGAEAYYSRGEFHAVNRLSNAVHRSRTLDFPPASMLEPGSPDHAAVIQRLDVMERLQRRWLSLPPP